jgi:hypothetical protein
MHRLGVRRILVNCAGWCSRPLPEGKPPSDCEPGFRTAYARRCGKRFWGRGRQHARRRSTTDIPIIVYPIRGGPRMKAVAIYARVSTAQQEKQGTIESQLAVLEEYAAEHENW